MAWLDGKDPDGNPLPQPSTGGISTPSADFLGTAYGSGQQWYRYEWIEEKQEVGWNLFWAEAPLNDANQTRVGYHDFSTGGPTWKCDDDSSAVWADHKNPLQKEDHGKEDVAWLLFQKVDSQGPVMNQVSHIQRVDTSGGKILKPPEEGEDLQQSADYSATYHFWGTVPDNPTS